jgi:hypothetical protein
VKKHSNASEKSGDVTRIPRQKPKDWVEFLRIEVADTEAGRKFLQQVQEFCNNYKNQVVMQFIRGSGESESWDD